MHDFADLKMYMERAHMAKGIHGLPKVSPGPAMPDPSGVARPQGRWPAPIFYPLGYPTPYGPDGVR
jgi:hypothetical protein